VNETLPFSSQESIPRP